jgi:glycosyltransferase involved in cell wall biosynthesis
MPHISILSPVYNAETILKELVLSIEVSVKQITLDLEVTI